jgi:hypothetical protein
MEEGVSHPRFQRAPRRRLKIGKSLAGDVGLLRSDDLLN